MYRKTLSFIFALTFLILWPTSISWAGCWKTANNQITKVWFDTCNPSQNRECDSECVEFEWTGGNFDLYGHGSGRIKIYRSGKVIKEENRILYFGSYEPNSIRRLSNGDEYIGETKGSYFNGQGVYLKKNGEKYFGHLKDSKPSDHLSYYVGTTLNYRGQWSNGIKSGKGVLYEKDKAIEGIWKDGKLHGFSIVKFQDGTVIEANFFNGSVTNKAKITYSSGDIYDGEIASNYSRNGYGTYRYKNGDEYQGQWTNNQQSGQGKYLEKGKAIKEGKWSEGQLSDIKKATQSYANGEKYVGEIKNGRRDGFGTYYFNNGSTYEGYWRIGKKNGRGKYTLTDGRFYEGDWENDKRHGFGVFAFRDGSKYQGNWKNDKRSGKGQLTFKDDTKYDGDWLGGVIAGEGTLVLPDGSNYSGDWESNRKTGKGIFVWKDKSSYDGEWKNDVPSGYGVYSWPNGDQYEGSMKDGYVDGSGTFFYANNDQYEGSFSLGQKSGYGRFFFANGNIYEGNFVDGQPNGAGIFTFNDGTRYEGEFSNGKFSGDGSLYINKGKTSLVYTGFWDGTNKLPKLASILFENGDLFEGETDGNGRPTSKGKWTTIADRESRGTAPQKSDSIHTANEFYKKHKESIDTGVLVVSSTLTVLYFTPAAPIAAPLLVGLNVIDASIETVSKSIDIADAQKVGEKERIAELQKERNQDLAVNAAFIFAPPAIKKSAKIIAKGLRPVAKSLTNQSIKQGKKLWRRVSVSINDGKVVKTMERSTNSNLTKNRSAPSKRNRITKVESEIIKKGKIREFNGKKVVQRDDIINKKLKDAKGKTNCDRMFKGSTPLGPDNMPIELHHSKQKETGLIIEMIYSEHKKYSKQLHHFRSESEIDRGAFDKWRGDYWRERAKGLCK